jgi:glutaredoxin
MVASLEIACKPMFAAENGDHGMMVQLVSRDGCHLCEMAEQALAEIGIEFERLDVDADQELARSYDFRVPVLLLDGRVEGEGLIERSTLIRLLAASEQ